MKILYLDEKPSYFSYFNKKVCAFSFFNSKSTVPKLVAEKQLEIFKKYNLDINIYDGDLRHPTFMDKIMEREEYDIYIFFDVDSIPLNDNVYDNILSLVDDNTIFGVSQQDNCNNLNHVYAAPSCLVFTRELFEKVGKPSFVERQRYYLNNKINLCKDFVIDNNIRYNNNDEFYYDIMDKITNIGGQLLCDVAEELTYRVEENNFKINFWYPTSSLTNNWKVGNYYFGNGTIYNNSVYHQFQIRNKEQIDIFISKCDSILKNNI